MSNRDILLNPKNVDWNTNLTPLLINPNIQYSQIVNNEDLIYNPGTSTLTVPNVELEKINGVDYIPGGGGGGSVDYTKQYNDYDRYPNVVGYYDFTDKDNLGFDQSGEAFHLENNGAEWAGDRGGSLLFRNAYDNEALTTMPGNPMGPTYDYIGIRYLEGKNNIDKIKNLVDFSISLWILPRATPDDPTRVQTFFSFRNTVSGGYLTLTWNDEKLTLKYFNPVGPINVEYLIQEDINNNIEPIEAGKWTHVVFKGGPNYNSLFINNEEYVPNTGDYTMNCSLSSLNIDYFTFGADKNPTDEYLYGNPLILSQISDILLFDDGVSNALVAQLYNSDYGYDVVVIAGQSNAVGYAVKGKTIDDLDYSKLRNRVYQYNTFYQLTAGAPTTIVPPPAGWSKIEPAFNPLLHPDPYTFSTDPVGFVGRRPTNPELDQYNDLYKIGSWKTFAEKYIKSFKNSKRKLLLLPAAEQGKGFNTGWGEGQYLESILITALNDIKNIPLVRLVGMIWNQGENDINNVDYIDHFKNLRQRLITQTDFFDEDTPIVMTKLSVPGGKNDAQYGPRTIRFNGWIDTLKAEYPTVIGSIETKDLNWESQYHYDVDGHRKMGVRYYEELVRLLNEDYTFPDYSKPLLTVDGDVRFKEDLKVDGTLTVRDITQTGYNPQTYRPFWTQAESSKQIQLGQVGTDVAAQSYYYGGCLAYNNKVYLGPAAARKIAVFDYKNDTVKLMGVNDDADGTGTNELYCAMVPTPNNKIYCIPRDQNICLIIDTLTDTFEYLKMFDTIVGNFFAGACLGPDGKIYCISRSAANNIISIDYTTNHCQEETSLSRTKNYNKGIYHPYANKMFLLNFSGTSSVDTVGVIDFNKAPDVRTVEEDKITGLTSSIFGACIGVDGFIYGVGYHFESNHAVCNLYIIDPFNYHIRAQNMPVAENTVRIKATTIYQHPDGNIYIVPANVGYLLMIQPQPIPAYLNRNYTDNPINFNENSFITTNVLIGLNNNTTAEVPVAKTSGAIILPDGRTFLPPNVGSVAVVVKPLSPQRHPNWMMDPIYNYF